MTISGDNLAKLARSGARQRHMAVLVASVSPAPFAVNYALLDDDVALPTVSPQLPDELTHCWVVSSWSSGRGLLWSPQGWAWFRQTSASTTLNCVRWNPGSVDDWARSGPPPKTRLVAVDCISCAQTTRAGASNLSLPAQTVACASLSAQMGIGCRHITV